jgi:hypothetical protein
MFRARRPIIIIQVKNGISHPLQRHWMMGGVPETWAGPSVWVPSRQMHVPLLKKEYGRNSRICDQS